MRKVPRIQMASRMIASYKPDASRRNSPGDVNGAGCEAGSGMCCALMTEEIPPSCRTLPGEVGAFYRHAGGMPIQPSDRTWAMKRSFERAAMEATLDHKSSRIAKRGGPGRD